MSIYSVNVLSVGQATIGRNVKIWKRDFLSPNEDRQLIFSVHIPLIYKHVFYKFVVRLSVSQATKPEIRERDFLGH